MKVHVTEKTFQLASGTKPVFTLLVQSQTTAHELREFLKSVYKVDLTSVRYATNAPKEVRRKGIKGTTNGRRKAYVTLKAGQRLPEFDVDTKEAKASTKEKPAAVTAKE